VLPELCAEPCRGAVPGVTILLGLILLCGSLAGVVVGVLTSVARPEGNLFVSGVVVGVAGMLGLRLVHGDVGRRLAARRLGRLRTRLLHDTRVVTLDRDRLAEELLEQRGEAGPDDEPHPDQVAALAGPGHGR
jgi:hypothetical protein